MTKAHMDQLANEVLKETGLPFSLFATNAQIRAHVWGLSFSNMDSRFFYQVTIDLYDHNTDDAVKAEIRQQLEKLFK
jgi:hypothetical protein